MLRHTTPQLRKLLTAFLLALLPGGLLMPAPSIAKDNAPVPYKALGWVGLFDDSILDWLDKEDFQLRERCDDDAENEADLKTCLGRHLKPILLSIPLRSKPDGQSSPRGSIEIEAIPGDGIRAFYRPPEGGRRQKFTPDLFLNDFSYGPYFHQTMLDRQGNWVKLPPHPFPAPVWIHLADLEGEPDFIFLESGMIVTFQERGYVIEDVKPTFVTLRKEQEADMACNSRIPPPRKPMPRAKVPLADLYDEDMHLLLDIRYPKGC